MPKPNTQSRRRGRTISLIILSIIILVMSIGRRSHLFHYLFAVAYLEPRWSNHDPQTQAEFEAITCCTDWRQIDPSASEWGSAHELQPGDRMIQYGLFGDFEFAFEVVFDQDDRLVELYTSYE